MSIVVTSAPDEELIELSAAKLHLRIYHDDLDGYVEDLLRAARDDCERWTARTLRTSTTRTIKLPNWWSCSYKLPYPPLLAVSSVAYYDADNASQTLAASNYHVEPSTDGFGKITWADDADLPDLYERPDAITITYTAGYTSSTYPPALRHAVLLRAEELFGVGSESQLKAADSAAKRLLNKFDVTGYA